MEKILSQCQHIDILKSFLRRFKILNILLAFKNICRSLIFCDCINNRNSFLNNLKIDLTLLMQIFKLMYYFRTLIICILLINNFLF